MPGGAPLTPAAEPVAARRVSSRLAGAVEPVGVSACRWGNFYSLVTSFAGAGAPQRPGGVRALGAGGAGGVWCVG